MDPAVLTLIVLGVAAFFFVTEIIPLAVTAMGASIALGLLGVLTPKQVFSGLSNSTVVLFAGMFVIGAAMFQTGLAQRIGITVVHAAGTGEKRLMAAIMIVTIILSSVSSNTATVACLLPVVVQICAVARLAVSPQLMALAVAANVGGTITMIGTPPNILMSATLSASGLQPFGFFEFAWIGIPLSIVGVIYMLTIGRRLCPHGHIDSNLSDLTSDLPKDTRKMAICAIILILVVVAMALSKTINVPMQTAAIIGALACVITGCLSEKQAYGGNDWTTIFLFAGMLPLAEAMDKTGAGAMIATASSASSAATPPRSSSSWRCSFCPAASRSSCRTRPPQRCSPRSASRLPSRSASRRSPCSWPSASPHPVPSRRRSPRRRTPLSSALASSTSWTMSRSACRSSSSR